MAEEEKTERLPSDVTDFLGMGERKTGGGTFIRPPSFAGGTDDFDDPTKKERKARFKASADMLFSTDVSKLDDAGASALYQSVTEGMFGLPDEDGSVAFGKRASKDPRANIDMLRKFVKGDYTLIEDPEYTKWRQMDDEAKFKYALEHETAGNMVKSKMKGERGTSPLVAMAAGDMSSYAIPWTEEQRKGQEIDREWREDAIRNSFYDSMDEEKKAAYRADVIADYDTKLSRRQTLATFLQFAHGLSDRAGYLLAKSFNDGTPDAANIEGLPEDERDRVYAALYLMRGDQKKGRILGIQTDFTDGTAVNRLQLGLYGFQQSVVGLVTDTGEMARDAAMWTYAKCAMDEDERKAFFKGWDAIARAEQAMKQNLPEADSLFGEAFQGVAENFHWFIPYGAIRKGGSLAKGARATIARAKLQKEVAEGGLTLAKAAAEASRARWLADVEGAVKAGKGAKKISEFSSAIAMRRQLAAVEQYTAALREIPNVVKAAKWKDAAGAGMWAAGEASAFSAFASEYIANADAAGISREESVLTAAAIGLINAKIEQLYVPGLESSLAPAQIKSLTFAAMAQAIKTDGAAGFRKWLANRVSKGVTEGMKVTLTEGAVEEPLQQMAIEHGKAFDSLCQELRKNGQATLANEAKALWDSFARTLPNDYATFIDTAADMVPSSLGFGVTTVGNMTRRQHIHNVMTRHANRRAGSTSTMMTAQTMQELQGATDYDAGLVDVIQQAVNVRTAVEKHWQGEEDGGEAKNPHRFEEAITAARRAWRDPKTGDAVQEIADAAGVDVKTAEVLAQYLQTEAEAMAFSPQARAWTALNMSLADIDEATIKTVLPGYVEGSFASDPENGIYSGRVRMDDGTEKTIAYRVGDLSAELVAEAQNMAKADSSFGKSFDARHAELGDGVTWASLSDSQRYAEAMRSQASVNGFSTGKSGVFELTDSKGEKVRVNADDIIYLANGRIGDIGYGPAATQGTVRHETFHSLWRFVRGTLADADVQQLAKTLGIDVTKDGWEVELDEKMAHEMERYASGHYVSHAVSSRFDKMLDSWAGKIINFFGQFGPSDEVTDPKTGKPYQLKGLYDSILRGELGSGALGVELRKVPQQTAERTATPTSSMPVEVTDADRAKAEAGARAEADESAKAEEKVVQPQSPKTQGENATVDESGAPAPKVVHTAENPADASTPNQVYYRVGLPNSPVKLVGRLEVRDASTGVITSTDADYHDRGNQNRDDKSEESRALVEKIGANPDPLQVGTVQPIASNGIVWALPNGDVIIGNHRVNGVRLGYEKGTAGELEKFVREEAAKRGIEIGADVKKPLLVFVLERIESPDGKADVHEVVRLANESQNRGFNVREQASNDAKILIDNNLLPRMAFRADGRIDETKSGDAIGKFRQESGAQGLIAEDGSLTEEGQTRIQNAALAALLGGEGNNALLQKIMSNAGRLDMQGELRALMKMTPELMALAEAKPAYDLRAPLAEALRLFTEWRDKDETARVENGKTRHDWREMKDGHRVRGLSWEAFMSQGDMFRAPSEEAKILGDLFAKAEQLRSFDREDVESAAGKKRVIDLISGYLTDYIGNARAVNTETDDMFGGSPATRAEVLAAQRAEETVDGGARFSIVSDPQTIDRLNGEKTVRVYRAMQYVEGVGLLPPMAAKVDGQWNSPAQIGDWLQADERPDLVKDGKFTLNKGNGASIRAAYNPYFHTSRSPLNDQFSSAYKRPNLVTVEVEVPESELTSGYRAEGAKDAVGEMSWHAGPVSSKLPAGKTRKVILSRWAKIVRVVPDSEVADRIAEMLDGEGISVPANTVTPSLRAELEKRGVRIEYTPEVIAQNIDELLKNFAAAKGKTTDEIFKTFSHDLLAVGQLPPNNNLPAELKVLDPTVRTSENYLLDHIYNHQHEKVYSEADVRRVLSLIGVNTEARIVRQRGSSSIAFVGANPGGGWDCIVVAPRRGQFYIFKTMFGQNRKPYQDKPTARFSVSGSSVRDNAVVSLLRGPLASIRDVDQTAGMITDSFGEGKRYSIAGKVAASNMGIKGAGDAEAMEKAGKDREEIWRTTGWWRGKDGKWRFELPSTKMKDARALYAALIEGHNETTLGKILDAPELFEAYPQLKDTKIILSPEHNDEAGGWYDRIKNEIVLFDAGLVSLKDMPSHERDLRDTYQRVLDSDEFVRRRFADMDAFGIEHGTVEEEREYARWWIERQDKGIARTNETKIRDLANDRGMWSTFGKIIHEVQHTVQRIEGFATGASGNEDGYSRFAGEVEARNASRREAMTPEERAATPPWATEDVPADRQIVRYSVSTPLVEAMQERERKELAPRAPQGESPFFAEAEGAVEIPIRALRTVKDEPERSIANARRYMEAAAAGNIPKRAPVSVVDNGDGTYTVIDGNATTWAAARGGLETVRANIVGKDRGTRLANSHYIVSEDKSGCDADGKLHTHGLDGLTGEAAREKAYEQAGENAPLLKTVVDAAAKAIGGEALHRKSVKKRQRVDEKATIDYNGDYSRVVDLIGGTLILDSSHDMADALKAIRKNLPQGASVAQVKKMSSPDAGGYWDVKVSVRFANGGIGEIIVVDRNINDAKFKRGGHDLYDYQRAIEEAKDTDELTAELYFALKQIELAIYSHNTPSAARHQATWASAKASASDSLTRFLDSHGRDFISSMDMGELKDLLEGSHLHQPASLDSYATPARSFIQNDISNSSLIGGKMGERISNSGLTVNGENDIGMKFSTEAPKSKMIYPQLRGMSDEELVSAAVAARIALGKSDKVSDRSVKVTTVQKLMRRLHPEWDTTKIGVESMRVMSGAQKLAKRIRDDIDRGVSDSLVLEHLPTTMREQFGREMRQEAREGARLGAFGVRANTALEERQAKIVEDAVRVQTGLDSDVIENVYGINLSETIMHLAENRFTEDDEQQDAAEEGEGSGDGEDTASTKEQTETTVEIDEKVKAVVDEIVEAARQQAEIDEKNRQNRKTEAARDAENEEDAGSMAGSEEAEGEDESEEEGASSEDDGDALAEAVKKSALDLANPRHLARFVAELARRDWIKEHGLAKDADVWRDLVAVQFLRKTAQSVYAKLVRDLTYSRSRETAMSRIAKLDNVPTVAGLLSEMEFLGALVNANRIQETQKELCTNLEKFLKKEFGARGRFTPDKEEGKRKVSAEAELRARYMRKCMWFTLDAAADEARQLQETLDALSVDFKDAGRDVDQSREFVETIRKLNVLREFGALRYKPVGEIEAAVQWWQDFARGESGDIVREMLDRDIRTKKAAHLLAVAFADPKRTTIREGGKADALNRFITGHMGFISLLQDCMRHASDADAAAVKDIIDYISREVQKAGDRSEAEKRRHNDAFHSAVEGIYGKSFNAVMKDMMAPDERFAKFMGVVGGKRVTPTKGRALQLLVSLLQEGRKIEVEDDDNPGRTKTVWEGGYHDNIVKHRREGQAAEIMRLLDPADMNMLKWLGQWYENNRSDLSGVCHSLFGIGVYAELPNYFPVKMMLETQGLEKGQGVGWTIFPKALTPRVRNERDFDTSADIFSMWASRMEEAAQWKHHAQLGLEMRGIFGRSELREAVRANHGASVDELMQGFITDILAGHGAYDRSTAGVQYFSDQIRGWTALCALGGNIGVMAKQTTSIPAFGFEIGLVNTAKYMVSAFTPEGMAAMGKIWDSEQRRTRWNLGSSEAVRNALNQQNAGVLKRMLQASMVTTKVGDVVPGLVVGQGIYRDCLARGMSEDDAMAETWSIIERTQQSGRMENQTSIQRRNKLGRIMFQFLSTQQQYLQYEVRAIREVIARPDSVKRWGSLGRAILLNHFILSSAYYWMGQLYKYALGQEPPEDELKDWVITCLLGPYGSLFVAGFCCKYTLERAIKGYSIKGGSSMLPMESWLKNQVNDGAKLLEAIFDSDGDTWDNMLDAAGRWMSDSNSVVRDLRKIYRYRVKDEPQKK